MFELLTESEVRMVRNRWQVISLLREGTSVRKVAEIANVGTDTVVRMSKLLRQNTKVKNFLESYTKAPKSGSKWVFGKVGDEE